MSETVERLRRRIDAAEELSSVTRTMKGLAAVSVRHFEQAASAVDEYEAIVELGLQIVLRDPDRALAFDPEPPTISETAFIVFGSNQGLCGPVNRQVASRTGDAIAELDHELAGVVAVGGRLGVELEVAGIAVSERIDLPGTIEGITARAEQLLLLVGEWRAKRPDLRVLLSFPRYGGRVAGYEPVIRQLLPYDTEWLRLLAVRPWPTRVLPTYTLPWPELFASLMRQTLLVRLHRSFAQTMAAIAASRLAAMQVAERDIDERLEELRLRHHQLRQTQITEELLDVVSGFEVLSE